MPVVAAAQAARRIQVGPEPVDMAAEPGRMAAPGTLVPAGIEFVGTVGRSQAD